MDQEFCRRSVFKWIWVIGISLVWILPTGSAQYVWVASTPGWEYMSGGNPLLPSWAAWSFDSVERTALVLICQPTGVPGDSPLQWMFLAWDRSADPRLISEQSIERHGLKHVRFASGGDLPRSSSPYGFHQVFPEGRHPVVRIVDGEPVEEQVGTLRLDHEQNEIAKFIIGNMTVGSDDREHFSLEGKWDVASEWVLRPCRGYMGR